MGYDHDAIENRWQAYWEQQRTFEAPLDTSKPKYYVLDMFPYPSGDGLHVGHVEGYTATDIVARYKRMRGFNVLHPMGWDAFGLPAERFAMKTGRHPAEIIEGTSGNFRKQLKRLGFSYDWSREINTTAPRYYKWTQWIFLQLYGSYFDRDAQKARPIEELPIPDEVRTEGDAAVRAYRDGRRLAYLEDAPVNWCPELRIVLANEEVAEHVEAGREVVRRPMRQWMLRITEYAERLLGDLEGLDWPSHVLEIQRNWVGRSEGAEIEFRVDGYEGDSLAVFTTRPDTLYGATYMVLAPEHPLVDLITDDGKRSAVEQYVERTLRRTERERQAESMEGKKSGVDTGARAVHPLTGETIPIWIADYVLMGYGTGAIMAVPGHDERDHAFATAMDIPIVPVVAPAGGEVDVSQEAFVGEGVAINSEIIDGLPTAQAKAKMIEHLVDQELGRARVTYKLRDWLFSRQRYWGEPFPLVHHPDGRVEPIDDLPVELPPMDDFQPSETGEPPLSKAEDWCAMPDGAMRETNTMPQWAGSCWYYLRFVDPTNTGEAWSKEAESYWMPIDLYVGGIEHAATHLLYSRFWQKVLFDLGHVSQPEPFKRLVNQGMILGATYVPKDKRRDSEGKKVSYLPEAVETIPGDEGGEPKYRVKDTGEVVEVQWDKMSKSRGNVVNPDDVIREYGADAIRLYEMFMGPLEQSAPWQTEGLGGVHRFLQRAYRLFFEEGDEGEPDSVRALPDGEGSEAQRKLIHKTIAEVTDRVDRLGFNTAISSLMVFVRDVVPRKGDGAPDMGGAQALAKNTGEAFALLLAPFAPHLAEEIWRALGHEASLAHEAWPQADEALLREDTFPLVIQFNGKRRGEIEAPKGASKEELQALAEGSEEVAKRLEGKTPKRVIVVPGRLINFVV